VLPPLVSLVSLERIARLAGAAGAPRSRGAPDDDVLAAYVSQLLYRLPPPWRHTCLKRGVVLYWLLRRAGRPVALHIGVRRDGAGALAAHAWLVKDGAPYLEQDPAHSARFTEIARFPSPAAG
jgi:hypothetical protein